jgi:hypothetical protein
MTIRELSEEDRRTVMYAIRQYGQGGYPFPDEHNINSFSSEFAAKCLYTVLDRAEINLAERQQIELIINKLEATLSSAD